MTVHFVGGSRDGETAQIKHPGRAVFHFEECDCCGAAVECRYERVGDSDRYRFQERHNCKIEEASA